MNKVDNQLKSVELLKIEFPDFWFNAYKNKNHFFNLVFEEATQYVEKLGLSKKLLEEDNCKELWERHCEFCFEKITINKNIGICFTSAKKNNYKVSNFIFLAMRLYKKNYKY